MTSPVLSLPFRFGPDGTAVTVEEGSAAGVAEAVAAACLTVRGDYPMLDDYGIVDPVFADVDAGDISACLAAHGPAGVTISTVTTTPAADGVTSAVTVEFSIDEDED